MKPDSKLMLLQRLSRRNSKTAGFPLMNKYVEE